MAFKAGAGLACSTFGRGLAYNTYPVGRTCRSLVIAYMDVDCGPLSLCRGPKRTACRLMQRVMASNGQSCLCQMNCTLVENFCHSWKCLMVETPRPTLGRLWEQPLARELCCKLQAVLLLCNSHKIDSPSCRASMRRSSAMAGTTALPLQQARMTHTACHLPVGNLMSRLAHSRARQSRHVLGSS